MVYFDQIMHHSAGNDQFALRTFLLAPDTDPSTFTTGRAHSNSFPSLNVIRLLILGGKNDGGGGYYIWAWRPSLSYPDALNKCSFFQYMKDRYKKFATQIGRGICYEIMVRYTDMYIALGQGQSNLWEQNFKPFVTGYIGNQV